MNFIGSILAPSDPPGIDKSLWHKVIREHPNLRLREPREVLNPFTKEHETIEPDPDAALVIVNSLEVGAMKWGSKGTNEIHVFGDRQCVDPIAHEVATRLGARFDPNALRARNPSGRVLERIWNSVSIYDGPDTFIDQFGALRPEVGHLYAAHWCQSEVRNGGFAQFSSNGTGILAPEALTGFRAIGLDVWAEILREAMESFGEPYPRDRAKRQEILNRISDSSEGKRKPFTDLDERFYNPLRVELALFQNTADQYAVDHDLDRPR